MTRNGLSVDLEDWFSLVRRRLWSIDGAPTERVVSATRVLLDLLDETGTKATFFVLGRVAETFPDLVREVAGRGHELGTHGHGHFRVDALGPDRFREELRLSSDAIERVTGRRPRGHRAPEFSITTRTPWAFDVLREQGFVYDSSVFPIRHPRYGIPDAPVAPYDAVSGLRELPLATLDLRPADHEMIRAAGFMAPHQAHTDDAGVEIDGSVQVGYGKTGVVNAGDHPEVEAFATCTTMVFMRPRRTPASV